MKKIISACVVAIILLAALCWVWYSSPSQLGAIVKAKCLDNLPAGQSCVQKEITEDERVQLIKGREETKEGYFKVVGPASLFNLVDNAIDAANSLQKAGKSSRLPNARAEAAQCAGSSLRLTHVLPEIPGRWSAVYATAAGKRILLVRDDFYGNGGAAAYFEYMQRVKVNQSAAVATLLRPRHGKRRLWMVSWTSSGVAFELNLEDEAGADGSYSLHDVLMIASEIDHRCTWERPKLSRPDMMG